MKELVGKTIRSVQVSMGETMLRFVCDEGQVTFEVDGDCCSNSWFADIVGYQALAGHCVANVREVELAEGTVPPADVPSNASLTATGRTKQDSDVLYGYVLTTDAGRCTIAFRNSSNGYYGGELRPITAEPTGTTWKTVSDDWSA